MDHVRIGGVCLLLLIIAAALPINVLAQTPSEDDNTANGAAPIISQSLLSKSTQGETITAEKLAKRNTGLKPLTTTNSKAAPVESQTPEPPETTTSAAAQTDIARAAPAQAASTAEPAPTPKADAPTPATDITTTPDMIVPDTAPTPASTESSLAPAADEKAISPENLTLGDVVSGSNASQNESANASAVALENVTSSTTASEDVNETETGESTSDETEIGTDRIWREGDSLEYTWTPQTFSGFFYDLENDVGTERLTIKLQSSGRSVDSGDLTYSSVAQETDFDFNDWGSYQVIGFMADKYFAGYKANDLFDKDRSLINDGQLRRVLIDSSDESTITTGSVLSLKEGYELRIKQIDLNGNKVYMALAKDGEEIDSKVISPDSLKSSTYQYKIEISGEDTPIIMAHISNVFASTESALVTVDGLFQISDTFAAVEDGDKYDKMKVTSVSDQGVEMENENSITLRKGSTAKIFGKVGFLVADSDEIRFAPVVERTGSYDVRGTVIDPSETKEFTWTPYNFEGFYYDIDDDVGTESLQARISGGSKIEEKDLIYQTSPQPVKFEFENWGKYDVIGFMADKYFAGFNNLTKFTDEVSAINEGQLRKVLLDNDDSQTIASGSVLSLEEGYELRIKQVDLNGNKVYLALARDGKEVDSKVVTPSSDPADRASNYLYKIDMGSLKDVPIIIAHVQSVFRSTESDLATVDAVFQVSENPESVEEGEIHGKMKVETLGTDGITMQNDGSISLGRGKTIEIMENLRIEVADSSKRLLAPIATKTGEGNEMSISVPDGVVNQPVSISVKSGTVALSGVQILLDATAIATTDISGSVSYTPANVGTFSVVAKKNGYNDAKANLVVRTAGEAAIMSAFEKANATLTGQMTINVPAEVVKGENFLISVVQGINQTPVDTAALFLDEESIGRTGPQGTMTYFANVTGEHTLKAEKEGFNSSTKKIMITSSLRVVNLTVPDKANAGSEIKISAIVENAGRNEDTRLMELKANDTVVDSKNATVKGGENTTVSFSYKPKDPGLSRISLDEQSKTVNVEKAQSNWLIALILVLLIAIGAGYYLYSTGELDGLQRQVKKMMQGR